MAVTARKVLELMDVELTDGNVEQMEVMLDAYMIYLERNAKYADLWRQNGYEDNAYNLRHKVSRVVQMSTRGDVSDDDDGLDVINYAAFWIRNVREGNRGAF